MLCPQELMHGRCDKTGDPEFACKMLSCLLEVCNNIAITFLSFLQEVVKKCSDDYMEGSH
jgi:hypothetical protein